VRGRWGSIALLGVVLAAIATGAATGSAAAATIPCPNLPLADRLEAADAAFVGRLVAVRTGATASSYRFDVLQQVKGPVSGVVEIRAAEPLTDSEGRAVTPPAEVGVFAALDGATLTTTSCLLTDPAALLAEADQPRGAAIKVVLGALLVIGVVLWALVRRRRGTRPELPGAPS
jgi:hypothetical protein